MPLEQALQTLRSDPELGPGFVEWRELPATEARYAPSPEGIAGRLLESLRRRGIARLYTHQAQAATHALRRENVVVVTPTASGKTLCYNLPVVQAILDDPEARALYLFPTKALAQDQIDELHGLIGDLGADIEHVHLRRRHAGRCAARGARGRATSSSPTRTCSTRASCPTTRSG